MIAMDATTGRRMSLLDHIRQSVRDILMTPLERASAAGLWIGNPELIDQPLNGVTVMRIYAAVAYRLALWEPRISLSSVNLNRDASGASPLSCRHHERRGRRILGAGAPGAAQ
jgi:phage baseplate assembly protein W